MVNPDWRKRLDVLPFAVLLALSFIVVFLGRSFPSQDGPLHLYYADVTRNLLLGTGLYDAGYQIRYYITPYITQTYLLAILLFWFEPLTAEKILVCLYVGGFCLGFRYLVRSLSPKNHTLSLCAFIFVFNYPLYKGFYNFCLGAALGLWIIGFWIRYSKQLVPRRSLVFTALILLMAVTHPVTLGFCLMFLLLHTAAELFWQASSMKRWYAPDVLARVVKQNLLPIAHVAGALLTVLWVTRFADADNDVQVAFVSVAQRFKELLLMNTIVPTRMRVWRLAAVVAVAAAGLAVIINLWHRRRELQRVNLALVLTSAACLVISVIAPAKVSGGTNIAQRFALYGFVLLLAAGASTPMPLFLRKLASVSAVALTLMILFTLADVNRGVLANVDFVLDAPPAAAETNMAWLPGETTGQTATLNWSPGRHAGAHYARRSKSVLLNFDWLYVPYMNLSPILKHGCMFDLNQTCLSTHSNGMGRPSIDIIVAEGTDAARVASLYGLNRRMSSHSLAIFSSSDFPLGTGDGTPELPR